jgi:hypothetical protein
MVSVTGAHAEPDAESRSSDRRRMSGGGGDELEEKRSGRILPAERERERDIVLSSCC